MHVHGGRSSQATATCIRTMDCAVCHEARAGDPVDPLTFPQSLREIVKTVMRWFKDHSCPVIEPGSTHAACRGAAIASLGVPCSVLSPALNCSLLLTPLGRLDEHVASDCIALHSSCWRALYASISEVCSGYVRVALFLATLCG